MRQTPLYLTTRELKELAKRLEELISIYSRFGPGEGRLARILTTAVIPEPRRKGK